MNMVQCQAGVVALVHLRVGVFNMPGKAHSVE